MAQTDTRHPDAAAPDADRPAATVSPVSVQADFYGGDGWIGFHVFKDLAGDAALLKELRDPRRHAGFRELTTQACQRQGP